MTPPSSNRDESRDPAIDGVDTLPSFLTALATDTDLWLFATSRGALTAGRVDPDGAILPYETDDRLALAHRVHGFVTLVRRAGDRNAAPWRPLDDACAASPGPVRLERDVEGSRLRYVARHDELALEWRATVAGCDRFGVVRIVELRNDASRAVELDVLDGVRGIQPWGAPLALWQRASTLVDAYTRADLLDGRLGVYALTAAIVDRPEAREVLRATVAWSAGAPADVVSLDPRAAEAFAAGTEVQPCEFTRGRRGAYFALRRVRLAPGESVRWAVALDTGLDGAALAGLRATLAETDATLAARIDEALAETRDGLRRIIASADGYMKSGREHADAHHTASTLCNVMRGGVFVDGYHVPLDDLRAYVASRDRRLASEHAAFFESLPSRVEVRRLHRELLACESPDLRRIVREYLPLFFGRRHGDPSRPWNRFSIRVRNADGSRRLHYEGNWRDIFQNWDALGISYPRFLPAMLARFVDASTADGHNPYRITRDGIEWEVIDPDDPWSFIGYWGDHQLAYLQPLVEAVRDVDHEALAAMLGDASFSYADVPYRIVDYARIVENPHRTIVFNTDLDARIAQRVAERGEDGKLMLDDAGRAVHGTLLEKLLVPALAKLGNFIPGAGVWMNTQRPEWNDANNALVGKGASMVTAFDLWSYVSGLESIVRDLAPSRVTLHREVAGWLARTGEILERQGDDFARPDDPAARRRAIDALGTAYSRYRHQVYAHGLTGATDLDRDEVAERLERMRRALEPTLRAARRDDGLFRAYTVVRFGNVRVDVSDLDPMLEGQVAAIRSGILDLRETVELVEALYASPLHREDLDTFLLYPNRTLPPFAERGIVPPDAIESVELLRELVSAGDASVVVRDVAGVVRFAPDVDGLDALDERLEVLARQPRWKEAVARDSEAVRAVFDRVFAHSRYTGRSGSMYRYEGLGCVYWHMVGKLVHAVQQAAARHWKESPAALRVRTRALYRRLRAGLGFEKSAQEFGAFPFEPYSHTPTEGGAAQPGLTGYAKEAVQIRFGELGVRVRDGRVSFDPVLLAHDDTLRAAATLSPAASGNALDVPAGALAFTLCGVPVRYTFGDEGERVEVTWRDGRTASVGGTTLDAETSDAVLGRRSDIRCIDVALDASRLDDEGPRDAH